MILTILDLVKEARYKGKKIYVCERCKFKYLEKKWAKGCEDWEKTHKGCNLAVIKHALK